MAFNPNSLPGRNGPTTQAHRQMAVEIAGLKADDLLLDGFVGQEGVSQLFAFDLTLLSETGVKLRPTDVLGRPATVRVNQLDGTPRFFHGVLSHFEHGGRDGRFQEYGAQLVPW